MIVGHWKDCATRYGRLAVRLMTSRSSHKTVREQKQCEVELYCIRMIKAEHVLGRIRCKCPAGERSALRFVLRTGENAPGQAREWAEGHMSITRRAEPACIRCSLVLSLESLAAWTRLLSPVGSGWARTKAVRSVLHQRIGLLH
jgi:hypothetical protein